MPVPTVTITGTWLLPDGVTPQAGRIVFTLPARVLSDGIEVARSTVTATLDETGSISVTFPRSDSTSPTGYTILVREILGSGLSVAYTIPLSADLDLADVVVPSTEIPDANALRGVAGGLAELDEIGLVINADGSRPGGGLAWTRVETLADLTPYLVGDEYVLPAGLVVINGTIDLGANAVRISAGTVLRGFADATLISSNTSGVLRATNVGNAVIVRELNVVATAGPCLDLTGGIDHQLNLFFVGLFGASAGTITGFNVQAVKQCYIDCADGLIHDGTTKKVFVSESPFYSIVGSAITLASTLVCDVIDFTTAFFKFDAPGVGVTAEAGYTVGDGLLRGCLIAGTATPLVGLDPGDVNWKMTDNTGIRDSVSAGQAALIGPATTVITTQGEYVPVTGAFTVSDFTERFTTNGSGEFVYTGRYPALVQFSASFTVDPANNVRVGFQATKNGVAIPQSQAYVEQGAGAGSSPRQGAVIALERLVEGDRIGLAVANLGSTTDIEWLSATYVVKG